MALPHQLHLLLLRCVGWLGAIGKQLRLDVIGDAELEEHLLLSVLDASHEVRLELHALGAAERAGEV